MFYGLLRRDHQGTDSCGRLVGLTTLALLLWSRPAHANVGLPMLVIAWPVMGYLFVPVLVLECAVAFRVLGGSWKRSTSAVVMANAVSTIVGVPLSWAVLVAGAIATSSLLSVLPEAVLDSPARWIMAPFAVSWLGPGVERHPWWIPAAFLGLLVPFFFMSVWVERVVLVRFGAWSRESVVSWSWQANLLSYGMIGVITAAVLFWSRQW